MTDTLGLLLIVLVHSASLQDGAGGYQVLQKLFETIKRSVHNRWCRLKLLWADAAYVSIVEKVRKAFGWKLDIVRRSDKAKGFEVLPHRWIVERTFGWLGRYRLLSQRMKRRECGTSIFQQSHKLRLQSNNSNIRMGD